MRSYKAAEAIEAYKFVKLDSGLKTATAPTDKIIGISDTVRTEADDVVDVFTIGEIAEIEAGSAFNEGDALTSDANGKAAIAKANENIGAIALEKAAAAGEIVKVRVVINRVITE